MSVRMLAAVIQRRSEYLVCLRPPQQPHGGLWGFPFAARQEDEAVPEAARREVEPLLQVSVKSVGSSLFSVADPQAGTVVDFVPMTISGEPKCPPQSALRWLPLEDLNSLLLTPPDRQFVEFLEGFVTKYRPNGPR